MAKHRINTDKQQLYVELSSVDNYAFLVEWPALNLKEKFLNYYGFKCYGQEILEIWNA